MPEGTGTSAPITTGSNGAGTGTGTGQGTGTSTAVAEPKVTFGSPDAIRPEAEEQTSSEESLETGGEGELSEFGDESFEDYEAAPDYTETFPKEVSEALKANPQLVKQVKRWYFENGRYKAIPGMDTPEKARDLVDKLETLGGLEGIERETAEAATLWNMLGAGDAGILDQLESEYSEGLVKLAPAVMERWMKLDPAGRNHEMAKVFMATLGDGGVEALNILAEIPEIAKNPEAKRQLEKILGIVNSVYKHAVNAPRTELTQADKRIKEREQKAAEKENVLYQREVSAKVVPILKKAALTAMTQVAKGRKLSDQAKKDLLADVNTEYSRLAKANADFQKNAKALLGANETEKFLKLCESNMARTMPLAARNVWRKYTGINQAEQDKRRAEGASRRESGGGSSAGGTVKTGTPRAGDVDWQRMRAEFGRDKAEDMFLFQRKYYKKGDKANLYSY